MDRAGFDPRYSPEFQRGFNPAVHDGPATNSETHERIPELPEGAAPRLTSVPPQPSSSDVGLVPQPPRPEPGDGAAAVDGAGTVDEIAVPPWRNPYLVVLTILGVVLLATGISAFRWSVEQVYRGQFGFGGEDEQAREAWLAAQVAWGLSPLLAFAGVMTLIGVIFFIAITWGSYRRPVDDESGDIGDVDQVG